MRDEPRLNGDLPQMRARRQARSLANEGMRAMRKAADKVTNTIRDLTPDL